MRTSGAEASYLMDSIGKNCLRSIHLGVVLVAVSALTACATFHPPERVEPPVELPATFSLYTGEESGPGQWWESFGSSELNRLVESSLEGNFDIRTAKARLDQARALARRAGADLSPTLNARAEAARRRASVRTGDNAETRITEIEEYTLGLAAAYEVDLWGRVRSARSAEVLDTQAAREDLDAAAVTVSAEVVNAWIDLVAVRREIVILAEQIEINEQLLRLQRLRFENGLATALDLSQQLESLAAVRAEMPRLQAREQLTLNGIVLLTGRAGHDGLQLSQEDLPVPLALPGTGLPADLLASRPDVRAAGFRLNASDWRIAAARADRLPALNLTAGGAFSSTSLDLLFSNWLTTLAASLTGPLLDGGRRSAEVERTRAVAEERLAAYGRTVAQAVREVEDGLAAELRQRETIERLGEQLDASRLAMDEARLRYVHGTGAYLNYVLAIQNTQRLERRIVTERAELLKLRTGLYRAMGGDWTRRLIDSGRAQITTGSHPGS
jgi:outer membrane protein, multidrug efflux system